ncbi:MAG: lipoprotein-releasing ABC transporter permease subunit [Alphaproteobacteria bacterium]|nr:lipoprotein-releasing ABC transporter permease subunit [Alphaproteobacteria bacterium]
MCARIGAVFSYRLDSVFERFIAFRYLRSSRQEGFVSVIAGFSLLGIAIGVATLIIVLSVMNGFRAELLGRIVGINGHIWILPTTASFEDHDKIAEIAKSIPGVLTAQPTIERQAVLMHKGQARGLQIHGMTVPDIKNRSVVANAIKVGSLDHLVEGKVLIGKRLADTLQINLHDRITLLNPDGNQTAFGTVPKQKSFEVAAIFEVGMNDYDKNIIFMHLDSAQHFFKMNSTVSNIELFVEDVEHAQQYAGLIQSKIGDHYKVLNWQHSSSPFFQAVEIERDVMFLILTLIILIAAFNIISSLIMLVKDKNKDIAILRTMGATRGSILKTFFITGASIGVIGTVVGVILGVSFALHIEEIRQFLQNVFGLDLFNAEIYHLTKFPAKMDIREVFTVVGMSLGLSFAATLYPAWKAARLNPVEALRQ